MVRHTPISFRGCTDISEDCQGVLRFQLSVPPGPSRHQSTGRRHSAVTNVGVDWYRSVTLHCLRPAYDCGMSGQKTTDLQPCKSNRRRNLGYVVENSSNRRHSGLDNQDELWNTSSTASRAARVTESPTVQSFTAESRVIVGYARVSKDKQDESLQLDALERAGCEKTFVDRMSGAREDRPQLEAMLAMLRAGDKVVIWKLDRLGRSLIHLVELVNRFKAMGVDLAFIAGDFVADTSTASGELTFHMFAALAQYERRLIIERTNAGLAAARARGRVGGRPRALNDKKVARAIEMMDTGASLRSAARQLNTHHSTLHRYLHPERYKFPMGRSSRQLEADRPGRAAAGC